MLCHQRKDGRTEQQKDIHEGWNIDVEVKQENKFGPKKIISWSFNSKFSIQLLNSELIKRTMHSLEILAFYESDDPKVCFLVF